MALGFVSRAVARGLAVLGEPSTLNGTPCGKVNIERDLDVNAGRLDNADDASIVRKDVATILSQYNPRVGQTLVHPDGTFKLDRRLDRNGYSERFIVVAA